MQSGQSLVHYIKKAKHDHTVLLFKNQECILKSCIIRHTAIYKEITMARGRMFLPTNLIMPKK